MKSSNFLNFIRQVSFLFLDQMQPQNIVALRPSLIAHVAEIKDYFQSNDQLDIQLIQAREEKFSVLSAYPSTTKSYQHAVTNFVAPIAAEPRLQWRKTRPRTPNACNQSARRAGTMQTLSRHSASRCNIHLLTSDRVSSLTHTATPRHGSPLSGDSVSAARGRSRKE